MTEVETLAGLVAQRNRELERRVGEARAVAAEGKELQEKVAGLEDELVACEEAIEVLRSFGEARQDELQRKIEALATHALATIFGDGMRLRIEQTTSGKLMGLHFLVQSDTSAGVVETPILDFRGGGVAAVVGFLLRLLIVLLQPNVRPILFLDETFAQLSAEYEPLLAEFIEELVSKTDCQIVLVTHSTSYEDSADTVYRFALKDGVTHVAAQ